MAGSDIAIILSIIGFLGAWLMRPLSFRGFVLLLFACVGVLSCVWGMMEDRWQVKDALFVTVGFVCVALFVLIRNKPRKTGFPFVSGSVFLICSSFGLYQLYLFPISSIPKPTGDYIVGVRDFELDDTSRLGVLGVDSNEERRLLLRVWYPAQDKVGIKRARYFRTKEVDHTAKGIGTLFGKPELLTHLGHVRTNSYENAPVLEGASDLPTILYSHGYLMYAGQHEALMENLVSHGYVVYAIQHSRDSSSTVFPDGDVVEMDMSIFEDASAQTKTKEMIASLSGTTFDERIQGVIGSSAQMFPYDGRFLQSIPVWFKDRLFVHNQLAEGKVPESVRDIVQISNWEKTGQMGMSFGGSVIGAICMVDKRCAAGVNIDGRDFHIQTIANEMPVPFLMIHSDLQKFYASEGVTPPGKGKTENDFSYERLDKIGLKDDFYRMEIQGAHHMGMSDLPLFIRDPLKTEFVGETPVEVIIQGQNDLIRSFFDKYLRDMSNDFPVSQLEPYKDWITEIDLTELREWWLALEPDVRIDIENQLKDLRAREAREMGIND